MSVCHPAIEHPPTILNEHKLKLMYRAYVSITIRVCVCAILECEAYTSRSTLTIQLPATFSYNFFSLGEYNGTHTGR